MDWLGVLVLSSYAFLAFIYMALVCFYDYSLCSPLSYLFGIKWYLLVHIDALSGLPWFPLALGYITTTNSLGKAVLT